MLEFQPHTSLGYLVLVGIVLTTIATSALMTLRWKWKAWPMAALAGLTIPFLVPVAVIVAASRYDGWGGFSFQATELILVVGVPSALAGYLGVMMLRKARLNGC